MIDEKKLAKAISNHFDGKKMTKDAWECLDAILHIIAQASNEAEAKRLDQALCEEWDKTE